MNRLSRSRLLHNARVGSMLGIIAMLVLLIVFMTRERGELRQAILTSRAANPVWLTLTILLGLFTQALMASTFIPILIRLKTPVGFAVLLRAHIQRFVVGTVVPVGGPPSMIAWTRVMNRNGLATNDAVFALLVNGVLGYASLVFVLIPVLILAAVEGAVSTIIIGGAVGLIVVFAAMLAAMLALLRGTSRAGHVVQRILPLRAVERAQQFIAQARSHGLRMRDVVTPLCIHIAVEIVGAAMLYCSLRAIGWQPSWSQAIIGYVVGTLFLLVTPVLQGTGTVELSMTVALTSLSVPAGIALGAVLLYRIADVWLPFAVGVAVQASEQADVRRATAHVPAVFTALSGVMAVLSGLVPEFSRHVGHLADYSLTDPADLSHHLTLVFGFLLVFLSFSLWRRKRIAWLAATTILASMIVMHVLKRDDLIATLLAGIALVLLIVHRRRYRVRSDVPTIGLGIARFALSLSFAVVYGTLGFFLMDRRSFRIDFSLPEALERTLRLYFYLGDSGLHPHTRYAAWFLDSLQIIGIVTVTYALFSLIRPVVWRHRTLPHERQRARQLIVRHGDSSLDFFKYYSDKLFFFSSTGEGVIAYKVALSTAVALGDPVATNQAELERVIEEFLDFCDANDWRVAFHQVPPTHLSSYRAAGLNTLKIGEDAIVDLTTFSTSGKSMKHVRSTINRFEREGYRAEWHAAPLNDDLVAELRSVSNAWLTIEGRRERTFTLGQFSEEYARSTSVMTVVDPQGAIVAFTNVIPDGVDGEATIDMMRRRPEPSGAMDFLQVRLFEHLRDAGFKTFSLGMAPFAQVGVGSGPSIPERAIHLFYERFNRFFAYKGLREYKDKFQPRWEPRYIVYTSEALLPIIALALVQITEIDPRFQEQPELDELQYTAEVLDEQAAPVLSRQKA